MRKLLELMSLILTMSFISLTNSCVSTPTIELDPLIYYKNDLCFKYDGDEYCGPTVLPAKDEYEFKFIGKGIINFFSFKTCGQEKVIDKNRFSHKVIYQPALEKERVGCPIRISAYSKKGLHAWTILLSEDQRFKLRSYVVCNGVEYSSSGTTLCETREGVLSKVSFQNEVEISKPIKGMADRNGPCPAITSKDKKTFLFKTPVRDCVYVFKDKKSGLKHLYYSIGYEQVPVRE